MRGTAARKKIRTIGRLVALGIFVAAAAGLALGGTPDAAGGAGGAEAAGGTKLLSEGTLTAIWLAHLLVERVRLADSGIAVEGEYELPPLARLSAEDQVFIMAFVRCHGSIKEIERIFGISYPTVKNRLNRIGEALDFVKVEQATGAGDVLGRLERGELTPGEALEELG